MEYKVLINKRIRYIRVYAIIKHLHGETNKLTKLFMKLFRVKEPGAEGP
ncbi:MAG: hypothetical protein M1448_00705 [Candidatus Marsarchaeota archaeon]|nr:hypothetical protein [Candidatus Marsarchaeota archaeon]